MVGIVCHEPRRSADYVAGNMTSYSCGLVSLTNPDKDPNDGFIPLPKRHLSLFCPLVTVDVPVVGSREEGEALAWYLSHFRHRYCFDICPALSTGEWFG